MYKLITTIITLIILTSCNSYGALSEENKQAPIDKSIDETLQTRPTPTPIENEEKSKHLVPYEKEDEVAKQEDQKVFGLELNDKTEKNSVPITKTPTPKIIPTPTPTPEPELPPIQIPAFTYFIPTPTPLPTPTPITPLILEGEGETLIFSGFTWDSGIVQNGVARYILEKGYGYRTGVITRRQSKTLQDLRNGEIDISMEIWPSQKTDWISALKQNEVFSLGNSLETNWQSTFIIPGHIQDSNPGLTNVQDLKNPEYQALFADPDSGGKAVLISFEGTANGQIDAYGLTDHVILRDPETTAGLKNMIEVAYENQAPMLFYYWGPTVLSNRLDMRILIQPHPSNCLNLDPSLGCAYPDSEVFIGVHSDYQGDDYTELRTFLEKWDWNASSQFPAEDYFNKVKNSSYNPSLDTAIWYLNNNGAWKDWVTPNAQKRINEALSTQYLSNLTNITNNSAHDYYADWSPDGTKIAFTSEKYENEHIFVMNTDGTNQVRLTNYKAQNRRPSWSPDGTRIAFDSKRDEMGEIYVMNSDGTNEIRITNDIYDDYKASWSPDGAKIAFTSERDGNAEIYTMNADGTNQTNITNNNVEDKYPSWSPNGDKIVFTSKRDGTDEIYTINPDGTNQIRLTYGDWEYKPSWSRDGTKIAFTSERDGNAEIYTMNADGTNQTRITYTFDINEWGPSWSPDGTRIAFDADRETNDENWEIFVMDNVSN